MFCARKYSERNEFTLSRRDPHVTNRRHVSPDFHLLLRLGLQLAIVPTFVHLHLGYNPLVAGLAISIQYAATLLSRPAAGHMADRRGGEFTAFLGLLTLAISSLVFIASAKALTHPATSLGALLVSRLLVSTCKDG